MGPGEDNESLRDVASGLEPGDVVELMGGATYEGGVVFDRHGAPGNPITIRGVPVHGRRPVVRGGRDTIEAAGDHYVFEGLILTAGEFRCFFHHADDITLRDSVIHDCPAHGLLGADDDSGSLLLETTEVFGCGEGDRRHQIYMATDEKAHPGSVFRMQHCYVHDGRGGNNVKSRAERNEIYFNWIEGALYHELELIGPEDEDPARAREDSDVVGNVFRKTNDAYSVRVGGDGTADTKGRFRFVNNTFLLAAKHRPVFRLFDGVESLEMHNTVIFRVGRGGVRVTLTEDVTWATGREIMVGSNNWIPGGSTDIPAGWTGTLEGDDPGFTSLGAFDLRPAEGSPLRDAAGLQPGSAEGHAFPRPLTSLSFQPPRRSIADAILVRGSDGKPDIGAYEGGFGFEAASKPSPPPASIRSQSPPPGSLGPSRAGAGGGRCGCRVGQREDPSTAWAVVGLGLLAIARRRRHQIERGATSR